MAELLGPDAPADVLGSTGVGVIHVAGGTDLSPGLALYHQASLDFATYSELAADEDTTKGGVGLEVALISVPEEVNAFEEETDGVPGAERLSAS